MSSTKHYDKLIKKRKLFTREEENLIFVSLVSVKQSIICEIIKNVEYFNKFKNIIKHYIDNDYLMDVFYFDPSFWEGSNADEIVDFYSCFLNSILMASSFEEVSVYFTMTYFTDEILTKLLDIVDDKTLESVEPMLSIISSMKNRIVEHNIAMALEIALKNKSALIVPIDDAIQCAMVGLSIGIDKHNPFLNTKLSTSAYAWIYQTVQRYNDINSDLIQVPSNIVEQNKKNSKVISKFMKENKYYPTVDQVCELAGNNSYAICQKQYESIDKQNNEGSADYRNDIEDSDPWDAINKLEYNKMSGKIQDIINKLNEKEKYVIEMLFGWNPDKEIHTHKHIMEKMNIDTNTFNKLRKSAFEAIKDNIEDDFTFENWRDVFSEEIC